MTSIRRKRFKRSQALQRYEKHRRRNLLAKPGPSAFVIVLDHLKAGFNVPKIFRSAQAFGAAEVHLINVDPFDPSPAKGAFRAVPARFFDEFDDSYRDLRGRGYSLFTLEPAGGSSLYECALPLRSAFVFGHEEVGLSFDPREFPDIRSLTIPQVGKVQSLNVSVAASIVMYEHVRRHQRLT
jgi:tRNA G18 (ribose-2'-O)-methylase SpoU